MKIKNVISSMLLCTALAGCSVGGSASTTTETTTTESTTEAVVETVEDKDYLIGVVQLVQHPALDAATQGFIDELKEELGLTDDNFDVQNAAGDTATCAQIANSLVNENVDLILANATPALQAAQNATTTIPVLGTAVTEYGTALGIEDFNGLVGTNISGTSDLAPLDQQAAMFAELLPDVTTVGILSCSAEANSKYQVNVVKTYLEEHGYTVNTYTFADSNDVAQVTQTACAENEALYIPTDNTAASCTEAINNVASQSKTPIITGEEGIMAGCGIATLSIDYYSLGKTTGQMAAKILKGEANVSEMEIEYYPNPVKEYMADRCEELGITVPSDYTAYTAE